MMLKLKKKLNPKVRKNVGSNVSAAVIYAIWKPIPKIFDSEEAVRWSGKIVIKYYKSQIIELIIFNE